MTENFRIRADLSLNSAKCTGCGACAVVCPRDAIKISSSEGVASINYTHARCLYCRRCSFACPEKAIEYGGTLEPGGLFSSVMHIEEKLEVELQVCRACGSTFMPKPLVTKAEELLRKEGIETPSLTPLCPRCRTRELFSRVYRRKGER